MNVLESTFTSNSSIYSFLVLVIWTVTSFICHYAGKVFLTQSEILGFQQESLEFKSNTWLGKSCHALVLTALQIALCYILVRQKRHTDTFDTDNPYSNMAVLCHALATFATNFSMAMMFASSTFAFKLMEPITNAFIQYVTLGIPLTSMSVICLPVVVGGAIVFAGNPLEYSSTSFGTLAAVVSNVVLAFRNIAIKQMTNNDMYIDLHWKRLVGCFLVGTLVCSLSLYLESVALVPVHSAITVTAVCISALFHVTYSYVSTGLVLTKMSVVSHAVSNILKGVLVVLLLYYFGQRQASGFNFLGLFGCTLGLMMYTLDKIHEDSITFKQASSLLFRKSIMFPFAISCGMLAFALSHFHGSVEDNTKISVFPNMPQSLYNLSTLSFKSTFDHDGLKKPTEQELLPTKIPYLPSEISKQLPYFLKRRIINAPEHANFLSRELKNVDEIIRESQRLHFNMLGDALKNYKYAMLFDIASFENKGDPCITAGEIYFLKRMNIEVVYYCNYHACIERNLAKAKVLAEQYGPTQLVILVHGGGNIIGYANNDLIRFKLLGKFPNFQILVFPQSIWFRPKSNSHVNRTISQYCCTSNLTLVLRDRLSYDIARQIYNGSSRLLMAPDMAFQIGRMQRMISPVFDILWLKRTDDETPGYSELNVVPKHLKVHISDWLKWLTPDAGSSLEKAFYIATNGFFFLQRGRVVITDRLHGHILSTLMDIPHVLIDNKAKKLSSYHNTWTKSLHNTLITDNPAKALELAINLLEKFNDTLPPLVPYLDIDEYFVPPHLGVPSIGYP